MNVIQRSILVALLLVMLGSTASAGQHPHTRTGWVWGLYGGWGWTSLSATDVSQEDPLVRESDTANDVTGGVRIGYGINEKFSLGVDMSGWKGDQGWSGEVDSDNFKSTVYWILAQCHWYPKATGFYLRAGVGLGYVGIEASDYYYGSISETTSGLGWTVGAGYELRLTPKFALGALYDYRAADVGELGSYYDDVSTTTQSFTFTFTWYTH